MANASLNTMSDGAELAQKLHDQAVLRGAQCSHDLEKIKPRTLYVQRKVENADEIIKWAKDQGFETTLQPGDMHVTVMYSRRPVNWMEMGNASLAVEVPVGGPRVVEPLGPKGAIVLHFNSNSLANRNAYMVSHGAVWEWKEYQPHITLTYKLPEGFDLSKVRPYSGRILLGPELFEEINLDFSDEIVEKNEAAILKVDDSLGLVFGWAIVSKVKGKPFFDSQDDHIPEHSMMKASMKFMMSDRIAKEMHIGDEKGKIIFAFPITEDTMKAMGIKCDYTGLMIAMKPDNPVVLEKCKAGVYTGFSIGGKRLKQYDVDESFDKRDPYEDPEQFDKVSSPELLKAAIPSENKDKEWMEAVTKVLEKGNAAIAQNGGQSPVAVHFHMPKVDIGAEVKMPDTMKFENVPVPIVNVPAPIVNMPPIVLPEQKAPIVNVAPPNVNVTPEFNIHEKAAPPAQPPHDPSKYTERVRVTKHDEKGRIVEFEKTLQEID